MNKDTSVVCYACNTTFRKIQYIKQHIKAQNVPKLNFVQCHKQIVSQCSQHRQIFVFVLKGVITFFLCSAMVHHKETSHDLKQFECPQCEIICYPNAYNHQAQHLNNKLFQCYRWKVHCFGPFHFIGPRRNQFSSCNVW